MKTKKAAQLTLHGLGLRGKSIVDGGDSLNVLVGEDVQLVEGRRGELGDNRLGKVENQ